jgi:hypothetical protein
MRKSSRQDELFRQWTVYRLEVVEKRARAMRERVGRESMEAEGIRRAIEG